MALLGGIVVATAITLAIVIGIHAVEKDCPNSFNILYNRNSLSSVLIYEFIFPTATTSQHILSYSMSIQWNGV